MNKADLISAVADTAELSKKESTAAVDAVLATIEDTVAKGESVELINFGTFEGRDRAARTGRNPQTGMTIPIEATRVPAFKPGKRFKDRVAGKA